MEHEQVPPEAPRPEAPRRSNLKWIVLAIGGGCALLACAAVVVALAGSFLYPLRRTTSAGTPVPVITSAPVEASPAMQQSANTMGDPSAPVRIVEYADFQCPYCRMYWQDTEKQIIDQYVKTGKVYYEYRSVGAYLGEESEASAEGAYCAGEQGKFWEYRDALFANWTGENVGDFTPAKLKQYAASVGLDQVAFEQCLSSGKMTERVQQDLQNAQRDGIKGTPSFIINGKMVEGAQPFSVFQQAIEQALQGK